MSGQSQSADGRQSPFPATLWTLVLEASQGEEVRSQEALRKLCTIYHQPILSWLSRRGCGPNDAEDFAQGFVEHLLTRNRFGHFVRGQARFRSFLLECLKRFLRDEWHKRVADKRGGGAPHVDIDKVDTGVMPDFDSTLDAEFAKQVHREALARLKEQFRAADRLARFKELTPYLLGQDTGVSYEEIGSRLGIKPSAVKKAVFDLRDDYFEFFREAVLQTVSREAAEQEMRYLLTLLVRMDGTHSA